jgi:hypothetical protein
LVNCGGLNGGRLAGDDDSVYPNRGVGIEVGISHFTKIYQHPTKLSGKSSVAQAFQLPGLDVVHHSNVKNGKITIFQ